MTINQLPVVRHRFVQVQTQWGTAEVFIREAGPRAAPTLLLLHGFPSASHQFRRLMDALGTNYHLIALDYPGFGHTRVPIDFEYSFDALARVCEQVVETLGLSDFTLYMFDFGGPIGLRLAMRQPGLISGLVIQNANTYAEGLSESAREVVSLRPGTPGAEDRVRELFTETVTRSQYQTGTADAQLVAPDGWTLDQHFLDRDDRQAAQTALALDYHNNVALYPSWQQWLRSHQPPTLVIWGRNDPFFPEQGAHAYLADLPNAEVHILNTGHFALEDRLADVAPLVAAFLDRTSTHRPRP